MKRFLSILMILTVLSPLALLMGCGDKSATKEENEAAKNAAKVAPAPAGSANAQTSKPKMAPPPP